MPKPNAYKPPANATGGGGHVAAAMARAKADAEAEAKAAAKVAAAAREEGGCQWQEATAADGSAYFYNTTTGETSWDKPAELMRADEVDELSGQ